MWSIFEPNGIWFSKPKIITYQRGESRDLRYSYTHIQVSSLFPPNSMPKVLQGCDVAI